MKKIKLGDKVKDTITGIQGIAIGRTTWLTGCDRITIQPIPKKGEVKIPEAITVDEPLVKIVEPQKKKISSDKKKGGFDLKVKKY